MLLCVSGCFCFVQLAVFWFSEWKFSSVISVPDKITIFSQNCQGLGNPQKRRAVFRHVRMKKYNIVCLQDTHIQSEQEPFIKAEWGNDDAYLVATIALVGEL